jgi:putative Mg2+ transporter-C (MgtC) family protein
MSQLNQWNMIVHVVVALGLGSLVGLERQWRARMAGLRTNALVAAGCALFVLLSKYGFLDIARLTGASYDGSRVAAQIVSGIGFIGGGVILREGLSVRGLNTAATLWSTAAVGSLAGAGLYVLACFGALVIVAANLVLRPLGRRIDRQPTAGAETETEYYFSAVVGERDEAHIRALLLQSLTGSGFQLRALHSRDSEAPGRVTVEAELSASTRDDSRLEQAVSRLSLEPSVSAVSWNVIEDAGYEAEENGDVPPPRRFRRWLARPDHS